MGKYQAYSTYRSSGSHWINDIPEHWDLVPLRAVLNFRNEANNPIKTEDVLSLSIAKGVTKYTEEGRGGNKKKDDISAYKLAYPNDIVMNSMNVIVGAVGVSQYFGAISPVYYALYADSEDVCLPYYGAIFQNEGFQRGLVRFGKGILMKVSDSGKLNTIRMKISQNDLKVMYFPKPPIEEQTQIAKFLDHETAKIDTLIEKQQQLIKLLKEKRQAVISHAVIKGLNPQAPMKDSGVEWLGEVPEHWSVLSIQRVLHRIEQGSSPVAQNRTPEKDEYGVLKISAIKKGNFYVSESKTLDSVRQFESRFRVSQGDLLVTRANTPSLVADACVINNEPTFPTMMCDLIYRLVTTNKINNHFLCMWLLSDFGRLQVEADARGSSMTMAKVSQGHIKAWLTVLPPINEQNDIVDYLKGVDKKFALLICQTERAIQLMQERRTALISAAVTGKIDVRNWQRDRLTNEDVCSDTV
ncbi:restriction endonuclease subunit S [Vibrio vulnificus]|nr:restriction endonuclease subunit S [Vibrio vulnificus]ELP8109116.1 restriction endonuclease subunit S [Vibrio vulnificus]